MDLYFCNIVKLISSKSIIEDIFGILYKDSHVVWIMTDFSFFFKDFVYFIFRQRGRKGEREKHQCVVASHVPLTGDLACNPGICPDWESNQWPFGLQPTLGHNKFFFLSNGYAFYFVPHCTGITSNTMLNSYYERGYHCFVSDLGKKTSRHSIIHH